MSVTLYAQPYDLSAAGFSFEDSAKKTAKIIVNVTIALVIASNIIEPYGPD